MTAGRAQSLLGHEPTVIIVDDLFEKPRRRRDLARNRHLASVARRRERRRMRRAGPGRPTPMLAALRRFERGSRRFHRRLLEWAAGMQSAFARTAEAMTHMGVGATPYREGALLDRVRALRVDRPDRVGTA